MRNRMQNPKIKQVDVNSCAWVHPIVPRLTRATIHLSVDTAPSLWDKGRQCVEGR
jgi:hypothetical protein